MKVSSVVGGLALVALALGWSGCASNAAAEQAPREAEGGGDVAEYYPLAVGNSWTYAVNGRSDKQVEVKILKEEEGFFHDSQGGQIMVDSFGIRDQKRYLLRGPVETGRSWTNVVSVSSTERYQIVRAGAPCEAPAGVFQNCVEVEGRNRVDTSTTLINTFTFAPGVGIVRIRLEAEQGGRRIPQTWLELTSYRTSPGQG